MPNCGLKPGYYSKRIVSDSRPEGRGKSKYFAMPFRAWVRKAYLYSFWDFSPESYLEVFLL